MLRSSQSLPVSFIALLLAHRWFDVALPASASNIAWLKPTAGDVYSSGTYIVGQWQSDDDMQGAAFRLCGYSGQGTEIGDGSGDMGEDEDAGDVGGADNTSCGSTVQPAVTQNSSNGLYQVTL
jgi:hypothetical protein